RHSHWTVPAGASSGTDSQSDRKPESQMGGNGDRPSRSSSVAEWLVTRLIFSHQPLLPHEEGQSSGRRKASEPPSASSTEPQKKRASGPRRKATRAAISSGRPPRPTGIGNWSRRGPIFSSALISAVIGVSM